MSKYQSQDPEHGLDATSQAAATIKTAATVTKTVKAKAPKAVATTAPKAKAPKAVATTAPKAKRAKGANNAKRARALEMFKDMTAQGLSPEKMLKAVQDELKITYANTYYYYSRVFKKA